MSYSKRMKSIACTDGTSYKNMILARRMAHAGHTAREICEAIGVTYAFDASCVRFLKKHGISARVGNKQGRAHKGQSTLVSSYHGHHTNDFLNGGG